MTQSSSRGYRMIPWIPVTATGQVKRLGALTRSDPEEPAMLQSNVDSERGNDETGQLSCQLARKPSQRLRWRKDVQLIGVAGSAN